MRTAETQPGAGSQPRRREGRESTRLEQGGAAAPPAFLRTPHASRSRLHQEDVNKSGPPANAAAPGSRSRGRRGSREPPRRLEAPPPGLERGASGAARRRLARGHLRAIPAPPALRRCAAPRPPPGIEGRGRAWGAHWLRMLCPREAGGANEMRFVCVARAGGGQGGGRCLDASGTLASARARARAEPREGVGVLERAKPLLQRVVVGPSRPPSRSALSPSESPEPRRCAHLLSTTSTPRLIVALQLGGGATRAPGSALSASRGGCRRGSRAEGCPARSEAADAAGGGKRASESRRGRGLTGRGWRARIRSGSRRTRLPGLR